jgi:RES domain-containing protein
MPKDRSNRPADQYQKTRQVMEYVVAHAGEFSGDAFRFANAGYATADVLISGDGAMQHGGRWNPRGEFPTTYLALDVETAWAEKLHSFRHYGLPLEHCLPACLVLIRVRLFQVLDLTTARHRERLGITVESMTAELPPAPGGDKHQAARHALARLVHAAGVEGLVVPSARRPRGTNLVVFPTNLGKTSRLVIVNPEGLPKRP